jgi:hypothetical protein
MTIEELLKSLNIESLDEAQQNSIKEKISDIIDVKARERADSLLAEEKESLVEDFEAKFEDYKNDITSKFSNFVDTVFEEELHIPEKVVQFARKGELYSDLIEQFKIRLSLDEGVLDDEVKNLLRDAKSEIESLKEDVNKITSKNLELVSDAKKMAGALYLREKCDGLTEEQKNKVLKILGDVYVKEEIDKKFNIIVDNILHEQKDDEEEEEEDESMTKCYCEKCDKVVEVKGPCSEAKCPECGGDLKDVESENTKLKGKGITESKDTKNGEEENTISPFEKDKKRWVNILRENK